MTDGLGAFIMQRRLELGLSQRRLSRIAEVPPSYMSQIEQGARTWPRKFIPGIAKALQVSQVSLAIHAGLIDNETEVRPITPAAEDFSPIEWDVYNILLQHKDHPHDVTEEIAVRAIAEAVALAAQRDIVERVSIEIGRAIRATQDAYEVWENATDGLWFGMEDAEQDGLLAGREEGLKQALALITDAFPADPSPQEDQ